MMKRHQHITKLQSELIQEIKLIDVKLDEAITKHCYLEKNKYQLPVVIPTIAFHVKLTKVNKTPNPTLNTVPITPPNTPSKPSMCNIPSKRHLSDTVKGNVKRIQKDVVAFKFHDEIDDSQLYTAEFN